MARMTKAARLEQELREEARLQQAHQNWLENDFPKTLLNLLFKAAELNVNVCMFPDREVKFYFKDAYTTLTEFPNKWEVEEVEYRLQELAAAKAEEQRKANLRAEVLSRLTAEEREALGV